MKNSRQTVKYSRMFARVSLTPLAGSNSGPTAVFSTDEVEAELCVYVQEKGMVRW